MGTDGYRTSNLLGDQPNEVVVPRGEGAPPFSPRNLRPRHMIAPAKPRRRDTAETRAAVNSGKLLQLLASPTGFEPVLPP